MTGPTSILLTWSPVAPEDRNGILIGYVIEVASNPAGLSTQATVSADTYTYTVTSLTPYTSYNCSVAGRTVNGSGPSNEILHIQTDEDGM